MSVASKNLYAYLGNDSDGEEKPVVPVKTVDKAPQNTTKRHVEPQAPVRNAGTGGNRRGPGGNEGAFRDRGAGSDRNHARSTEEPARGGPRGGYGARGRGGRGGRFPRERDDRHPSRHTGGSDKQAAQSGATEGEAELKDEQAGEAIAQSEKKEAIAEDAAPEEPAEPEDKSISYKDYLAQLAEKKAALEGDLKIREANEGSKLDKKWASAKPLEKEEDDYVAPTAGKKQRERERKVKQTVDFDPRFVEPERTRGGGRGGRGGPRGGRGGDRGERGGGERGRGGNYRGGNRPAGRENAAPINTRDESAFPSLGK
ncbi:hypothetical protein B0I35DRAFT_42915 [Stachybotrys elegans]|uniref:Hyaluronan/mRNA-binding protein domain-containing protein n=1 Tax=Stachybotrys elegans TaxID=80388 RepID=A0A8K0WYB6_9HYPO|nr:hypothetical protein B0I35DRAFT_42915 [Stachybotrys elegans]